MREQQVKFCLVTFANDDLALFKAKVESQGKISIDVFPVYDSTVRDAYIQVLEEVCHDLLDHRLS